jgi:hypothetical protein
VDANDIREQMLGLLQLGWQLVTIVTFLMWFHRVHRNLPSLGARYLKYSPGWAVGSFFVPILNLFRPYQIMVEVWENSQLESPSSSSPVGWWWAFWIAMNIVGQFSFRIMALAEDLQTFVLGTWLQIIVLAISLPAAILAIQVIRAITANQDLRDAALAQPIILDLPENASEVR